MNKTKIDYLDYTWNPIAMRCTPISEGCRECWHLKAAKRLAANVAVEMEKRIAYAGGNPFLDTIELEAPFHLKKPSRIGVHFMGDLFHESIPFNFRFSTFCIMGAEEVGHHSFFVLTKRPERMADFFRIFTDLDPGMTASALWERVWLGVSAEDQKTADERIPTLLQIPAAHRWVSVEPILGPVDLKFHLGLAANHDDLRGLLTWVVCGGETGSKARPVHPDWIRSLRDQCQAASVPFFFKSYGEWAEADIIPGGDGTVEIIYAPGYPEGFFRRSDALTRRVGHKHSGHLLDGKEWRQLPDPK
jgi:protein gp37